MTCGYPLVADCSPLKHSNRSDWGLGRMAVSPRYPIPAAVRGEVILFPLLSFGSFLPPFQAGRRIEQ